MANLNDGSEGPPAGLQVLLQSNCHGARLETYNVSCSFAAIRWLSARFKFTFAIICSFKRSFFLEKYPTPWTYHSLFIHFSTGLTGSPPTHFLAIVNKNPENTLYTLFFANLLIISVYISLDKYLGMPLLSQRECTCLNTRTFQTFL